MTKTIFTNINGKTYLFSDPNSPGFFDIKGTFYNWDSTDKTPETLLLFLCKEGSGEDECIELDNDNYYYISLCEYSSDLNLFEIHIECVKDECDSSISYNYVRAKEEQFTFNTNETIQVEILIYNSSEELEQRYLRRNKKPLRGCLKFPQPPNYDCSPLEEKIIDFDPKRKKGNILVGG